MNSHNDYAPRKRICKPTGRSTRFQRRKQSSKPSANSFIGQNDITGNKHASEPHNI